MVVDGPQTELVNAPGAALGIILSRGARTAIVRHSPTISMRTRETG